MDDGITRFAFEGASGHETRRQKVIEEVEIGKNPVMSISLILPC
jgi:hypothetical protein